MGPIISRLFTCSNEEKIKAKKQRVLALVLSLWFEQARFIFTNKSGTFQGREKLATL
jgi:hypothetical protein